MGEFIFGLDRPVLPPGGVNRLSWFRLLCHNIVILYYELQNAINVREKA